MTNIIQIQEDVKSQLAKPEVMNALVATTFKGLKPEVVMQAITEGVIRGFEFKDFLERNVYAIPYGTGYSLVTSIDYARKIGGRSGVVGKSAPKYEVENGKVISCTVTVKKQIGGTIGEFTETVYFDEYTTGRNLWQTKPRTMIAKVAEMHALRMACPEELSQIYGEEELEKGDGHKAAVVIDLDSHKAKLEATKSLDELRTVWASLPPEAKTALEDVKNALKVKFTAEPANENS